MFFSGKKPRKKNLKKQHPATPELLAKTSYNSTIEPLDLLLKKGLIDKNQHQAGMHFKWLYTVRYGIPNITAYNPFPEFTKKRITRDHEWYEDKENEYKFLVNKLNYNNLLNYMMDICVHNIPPKFLVYKGDNITKLKEHSNSYMFHLDKIKKGLSFMEELLYNRGWLSA